MRTKNSNLIILHHEEVFATREIALEYLTDFYKPNSLEAEPVLVKYGSERTPSVILAFGTTSNVPGGFFAIDITKTDEEVQALAEQVSTDREEIESITQSITEIVNAAGFDVDDNKIVDKITYKPDTSDSVIGTAVTLAQAIDLISKYAQGNEIATEDTSSIAFVYEVNPQGGKTLKANVKISTNGDADELDFNNNIVGIKNDGIYAASNLAYDDVRRELIFTTSGYKNGRFMDDANIQRVSFGDCINIIEGGSTDTLTTNVQQIVEGRVKVTGDVKLGSTNSIVVRNGGLEANISIDVDNVANKLIIHIGNETIVKQLPGIEIFENAEYDDVNETLVITFTTGRTLVIPVHALISTWEVDNNPNSPVTLTKTIITGGTDKLSADIKLRSTDNLISNTNGQLSVSEAAIDNKVAVETQRATVAEAGLHDAVTLLAGQTDTRFAAQDEEISDVADSVVAERERATAAENTIGTTANSAQQLATEAKTIANAATADIATLRTDLATVSTTLDNLEDVVAGNVEDIAAVSQALAQETTARTVAETQINADIDAVETAIATETARAEAAEAELVIDVADSNTVTMTKNGHVISADVKVKTISGAASGNIIKSDSEGIFATVTLDYNSSTNVLTFNDGNGAKNIQLTGVDLIEDGYYDNVNKQIVIVIKQGDVTRQITIPVGDLVDTIAVADTQGSPIHMTLTESNGTSTISATLQVLADPDNQNLLTIEGGALFASRNADYHTASLNGEDMSVQNALDRLYGKLHQIDIIKEKMEEMEAEFAALTERVDSFDEKITDAVARATAAEETANALEARVVAIEQWIENVIDFGTYTAAGGGE